MRSDQQLRGVLVYLKPLYKPPEGSWMLVVNQYMPLAAPSQIRRNSRPQTPPCLSPSVKDSEPGQQVHMPFAHLQTGPRWTIISGNSRESWRR